jgi:hypothetical protein
MAGRKSDRSQWLYTVVYHGTFLEISGAYSD